MLKKFKNWYKNVFGSRREVVREEAMDVKNHRVDIRNVTYFVAKALFTDIPEMIEIERAVYSGQAPWDSTAFANELRREKDRLYLVIRKNDKLLAFIGSTFDERNRDAHITNIAVLPEYQSKGLGRFLLGIMIRKARKLNYKTVSLEVRVSNKNAQRLYRDLQFEQTGIKRGYYFGDHEDAADMVLFLNENEDEAQDGVAPQTREQN
ncbi:ribosomal protein S18-alanine N-acetyltransferase [Levilactobacillus tujiorum]|uniref:Ribosomal protein S18-alanine N-acetyltransferase n=1 Tax=Levilactobacillus tujiorum TaxID=2912243 RepID=A0ABX1L593_9LACO|nr:ribosomal protein S18-alanine N-acetyltransferase [Levilactobacillus tujiorum]MCH5464434.1 ribosomal protein S18-alanine N-acetyltransferase [Levilactobacillus tujiorum]NLR11454.1 ribosomal protein S18-alanine N-acetyltransferase [Lactobacillus sp. HBUAS51387]NLR29464.1 ribosomal protein S18-alanine N-acetyltransferase [Levilactobacillus tujiorum]